MGLYMSVCLGFPITRRPPWPVVIHCWKAKENETLYFWSENWKEKGTTSIKELKAKVVLLDATETLAWRGA
jgi:hypothetical protein